MSEKHKPTYDLHSFKEWADTDEFTATGTALRSALELGFSRTDMVDVIQTMRREHFRNSMTSHHNHTVWQDVYNVPSRIGELYVKFRSDAVSEFVLLSYKEKAND